MEMPVKGFIVLCAVASAILTASFTGCATQTDSPAPVATSEGTLPVTTQAQTSVVISTKLTVKPSSTAVSPITTPPLITLDPAPPSAYQQMVDSFRAVASSAPIPESLKTANSGDYQRPAEAFDVNNYFAVLKHLTMQPDYLLDYVYHGDSLGAQPYIYARKSTDPPFKTLTELEKASKEQASPVYDLNKSNYVYMEHIRVDDTPEGFFQFIVLRIAADQFYLFWHANYNDHKMICDHEALDKTLLSLRGSYGIPDEKLYDLQKQSARLDLKPKIEIGDESVKVTIFTFTKWGGLIQREYSIPRQFPHRVIENKPITLITFDCGLRF
jgi:hypothetical protein